MSGSLLFRNSVEDGHDDSSFSVALFRLVFRAVLCGLIK